MAWQETKDRAISKLNELADAKYNSTYNQQIQNTANQIANYGNYNGKYTKALNDTVNYLANYGAYNSRYQNQLDSLTSQIGNYGPYNSKYQGKLDNVTNQIANYGDYASKYQNQIDSLMAQLGNWNYDPEQDTSYQAYKQVYTDAGNKAMRDTLGQVSARTGGLASSYAASAAQQSYNNYMQQLAALVPQLEQQAYNRASNTLNMYNTQDASDYGRWQDRRSDLYNQANLYQNLDATEYGRYQDYFNQLLSQQAMYQNLDATDYGRYQDVYSYLMNQASLYSGLDQTEYGRWADALNNLYAQNSMYQSMDQNELAVWKALQDEGWNQQDALRALAEWEYEQEMAALAGAGGSGGSGGGGGRGGSGSGTNEAMSNLGSQIGQMLSDSSYVTAQLNAAALEAAQQLAAANEKKNDEPRASTAKGRTTTYINPDWYIDTYDK